MHKSICGRAAKLCAVSMAAVLSFHIPAHASTIQMLPPTDYTGQPCAGATAGILQWDGSTPIRCVPGSSGDSSGDVVFNGTVRPANTGIQAGTACATEGAIAYDSISASHHLVYCSQTGLWAAVGTSTSYVGFPNQSSEVNGDAPDTVLEETLIPASQGVCFLVAIREDNPGSQCGLSVDSNGNWTLRTSNYTEGGRVECEAGCVKGLNQ
jgi:hypothetical protein